MRQAVQMQETKFLKVLKQKEKRNGGMSGEQDKNHKGKEGRRG